MINVEYYTLISFLLLAIAKVNRSEEQFIENDYIDYGESSAIIKENEGTFQNIGTGSK